MNCLWDKVLVLICKPMQMNWLWDKVLVLICRPMQDLAVKIRVTGFLDSLNTGFHPPLLSGRSAGVGWGARTRRSDSKTSASTISLAKRHFSEVFRTIFDHFRAHPTSTHPRVSDPGLHINTDTRNPVIPQTIIGGCFLMRTYCLQRRKISELERKRSTFHEKVIFSQILKSFES